ncbi:class I SAM-dependent methyltransferase [Fontivita pretiosa]|uniref:class I SAM-dependent methyltransferase n=1 Tax=Fontivita pretiosa TaxID=2989684 RepID=UPI003D17BE09
MPTVLNNRSQWNDTYDWSEGGEEWSREWGGADMQWFGTLLPRLHVFLPVGTILELAPGFGRWTHFLKDHCRRLIAVDLSEKCIQACRRRFAASPHVECHVNDGKSLEMVPDGSVDLVFSFDSLVHVEDDVIGAYLQQLAIKMRPDAVGFIHHSNLAECLAKHRWLRSTRLGQKLGRRLGLIERFEHWRGRSMSAARFERLATDAGLRCIAQETFPWHGMRHPIDCISTFTPMRSRWARPNRVYRNLRFLDEAQSWRVLAGLYGASSMATTGSADPSVSPQRSMLVHT